MVLDSFYDAIRRAIGAADAGKKLASIGFGVGTNSPQPSDTALTDAYIKPILAVEFAVDNPRLLRVRFLLERGEAVGLRISEIGLFCADGTLVARRVRPSPIEITVDDEYGDIWEILI